MNPVFSVSKNQWAHKGVHPEGKPQSEWDEHERMLYSPLPAYLEPFQCSCEEPIPLGYTAELHTDHQEWLTSVWKTGMSIDDRIVRAAPIGMFCGECLLAIGYTVFNAVRTCEGCGSIYLPKPVRETYPIKYFLCPKCDVPARPRRKATQ